MGDYRTLESLYAKVSGFARRAGFFRLRKAAYWPWVARASVSSTLAGKCVSDRERTLSLMEIIDDALPVGCEVADLGAGTGILGFAAAHKGASKVTFVEQDPRLVRFIGDAARKLGYREAGPQRYETSRTRLEVVRADAREYVLCAPLDAVIAELVGSGLMDEHLVPAMRNIMPHCASGCLRYPQEVFLSLSLGRWNMRYSRKDEDAWSSLGGPVIYARIDLREDILQRIDASVEVSVSKEGPLTDIGIFTSLGYPGGHATHAFDTLCAPLRISLGASSPGRVAAGDRVRVSIAYDIGEYPRLLKAEKI